MKTVLQYDLDGNFLREYRSAEEAARAVGILDGSNIAGACRGKYITAGGYQWSYKYDSQTLKQMEIITKPVAQLDRYGRIVGIYGSISEASRATGLPKPNICAAANKRLKSCGGYVWVYATEGMTVEAEMEQPVKRGKPKLPFTYTTICKDTDSALKAVAMVKERIRETKPIQSAERVLRALCGIEVGLDYYDEYLTVLFDSGFVIYVPKQPLSDSFLVLLARLVLSCAKLHSDAGAFFIGYFDGRWVNICRCGNDVDGLLAKLKGGEQ